jgi:hypothetical protein
VSLMGLGLGLALGFGLTMLLEMTDVRIRREEDLEDLTKARILVGIPHLDIPGEERSRAFSRYAEIGVGILLIVAMLLGNLYSFYRS